MREREGLKTYLQYRMKTVSGHKVSGWLGSDTAWRVKRGGPMQSLLGTKCTTTTESVQVSQSVHCYKWSE
jgi:hypothetical protein